MRPSTVDFGNVYVGRATDWQRIAVINRTSSDLVIRSITTTAPDQFDIDGGTCVRDGIVPAEVVRKLVEL